jgi:hypothetical protein
VTFGSADPRLAPRRRPALRATSTSELRWTRGLGKRLAPLVQAGDLDDLMTLVVRLAEEIACSEDGFLVLTDRRSHEPDFSSARNAHGASVRPALVRPVFAGNGVMARLGHGVHVPVPPALEGAEPTLLLPLVHNSSLEAVLSVTPAAPPRGTGRRVEPLRELTQQAAPLVARLREIEELRALVRGLTLLVQGGAESEARVQNLEDAVRSARLEGRLKSHLVDNVNHALRTPLVAIRGYTRLLLENGGGVTDSTRRQYLDVVARNVDRLVDIAANLMAPPHVHLDLGAVDAVGCCREALAAARPAASARGIVFAERLPGTPVCLLGDATHLRRLFTELVTGALEVANAGDELRAELSDETHRVVVKLTCGPAAAKDAPEMGASHAAVASQGRSLRLATVRELANLHGGALAVTREGAGSQAYSIVLPRATLEHASID